MSVVGRVVPLDVYTDLVCPWCFIGKKRLERTIAMHPELDVRIRYRAYELRPDLPPEGSDAVKFYTQKYGGAKGMEAAFSRVVEVGAKEGIRFDFARVLRAPSSFLAHRVVQLARDLGDQGATVDALFRGYFEDGVDIGEREQLVQLLKAREVPFDYTRLAMRLDGDGGIAEVRADENTAAEMEVDAVPFFLASNVFGLRGAAAIDDFEEMLETADARRVSPQPHRPPPNVAVRMMS